MSSACLDENEIAELATGRLRAQRLEEAERHLDVCAQCRGLVADLAGLATAGPTTAGPDGPSATTVVPGQRIDHFEVIGPLGGGGMGDVYSATDTKLDRKVALKMVRTNLLRSREAIARFEREAKATARFNHPNIVTIHAVGEHDGRPYVALEYLRGRTLQQRLRSGPLDLTEALRIAESVTEALAEAHRHGVLHRDLSPANVHLGEDGRVRVLDFGLAKFVGIPEPGWEPSQGGGAEIFETQATDGGIGTPTSMAPEQWRGEPATQSTDVWALGVLLYAMLTAQRPFHGDNLDALSARVLADEPAPRLAVSGAIPLAIADLVARCLDKRADRRPTVSEATEKIRAVATETRPVAPGAPSRSRSMILWVAVALVAIGGGIAWTVQPGAEPPTRLPPRAAAPSKAPPAEPVPAAVPVDDPPPPQPSAPSAEPAADPEPQPAPSSTAGRATKPRKTSPSRRSPTKRGKDLFRTRE